MNSITRLILRRLISDRVNLTPEVLQALKDCHREHAAVAATDPGQSRRPAGDVHPTVRFSPATQASLSPPRNEPSNQVRS